MYVCVCVYVCVGETISLVLCTVERQQSACKNNNNKALEGKGYEKSNTVRETKSEQKKDARGMSANDGKCTNPFLFSRFFFVSCKRSPNTNTHTYIYILLRRCMRVRVGRVSKSAIAKSSRPQSKKICFSHHSRSGVGAVEKVGVKKGKGGGRRRGHRERERERWILWQCTACSFMLV